MTQLSGVFMCHHKSCRIERMWELMRGGKRARCTGCGDVYPCRGSCEHLDCADTRKQLGEDDEPVTVCAAEPLAPEFTISEPPIVEVEPKAAMTWGPEHNPSAEYRKLTPEEKRARDRARVAAWRAAKKGKSP